MILFILLFFRKSKSYQCRKCKTWSSDSDVLYCSNSVMLWDKWNARWRDYDAGYMWHEVIKCKDCGRKYRIVNGC